MFHVIEHAILDSLILFPFLFLIYLLLELFEHKARGFRNERILKGKFSPLLAGAAGLVPECGFSVMASSLYSKKYITIGTLFTVFIVTSDEAVPILLSAPGEWKTILLLLGLKFVFGVAVGFIINFLFRKRALIEENLSLAETEAHAGCSHCHKEDGNVKRYLLNPLLHALKVLLFIFIVNLAMGIIIHYTGEDKIAAFLEKSKFFQPFIAALVGLIPNCASSVVLTEVYLNGALNFGSLFAGLCVNAGMGFVILFKQNKNMKENILILVSLYIIAVFAGSVISLVY